MLRTVVAAVSLWLALPLSGCLPPIPVGGSGRISKVEAVAKGASVMLAASLLATKLAKIEAEFQERRQKLTVVSAGTESEAYRAKEVESLVDSTEDHVLDVLEGKKLAALRDSVRQRFRSVRHDLNASAQSGWLHEQAGIRLAAFRRNRADLQGLLLRAIAEPRLDILRNMLKAVKDLAAESHFTVQLCVISQPEPGATFRMWPPEDQDEALKGDTTRNIQEAPLGLYLYRVKYGKRSLQERFGSIECKDPYDPCSVDLFDSKGAQLVVCDFTEGRCKISHLSSEACPPQ